MDEVRIIASQLKIGRGQVHATIGLLDSGNTVPFIARYRKEVTKNLDDEQVQNVALSLKKLRAVSERRDTIFKALEVQGKLSDKLRTALLRAETVTDLEDLYAPYKKKRETRGRIARKQGLMPLAIQIFKQPVDKKSSAEYAAPYMKGETPTADHVWQGARDIVAELISDNASVRQAFRRRALKYGKLTSKKIKDADDPKNLYALYYDFSHNASGLRPHQILALNRGEKEKILRIKVTLSDHDKLVSIRTAARPNPASPLHDQLVEAMDDAVKRLLVPASERDVRRELTEKAESHAIGVFGQNLRDLLNQPPLLNQNILAIDPGYRTGCKIATIDKTGKVLSTGAIYPHKPQKQYDDALKRLLADVKRHNVTLIAIGNGTASRETEQLVAEVTRNIEGVKYLIVNEAGASVYSASPLARQEMPDLDVTLRGAVSIGRRVQDPLAELVKIDPKSIGVGLYQHDVNQKQLNEALDGVVQLVVNRVGVDLNTASPALLAHVAGIGPKLSEKIVEFRDEHGPFANRSRLQKVAGLGAKAYEQCAGFLRIRDSSNPLDGTAIHPESYRVAQSLMQKAQIALDMSDDEKKVALEQLPALGQLSAELKTGEPTLNDILDQILQPGRDPRADLTPPLLRSDVLSIEDLQPGIALYGTVRNVVDFGAFIDIGVKRDGLLHRSSVPKGQTLNVGQVLEVVIKEVDNQRGRISLEWSTENS